MYYSVEPNESDYGPVCGSPVRCVDTRRPPPSSPQGPPSDGGHCSRPGLCPCVLLYIQDGLSLKPGWI